MVLSFNKCIALSNILIDAEASKKLKVDPIIVYDYLNSDKDDAATPWLNPSEFVNYLKSIQENYTAMIDSGSLITF